jgi:predicted N-acetyltransferase YhbS
MAFTDIAADEACAAEALFRATFTASEGPGEGALIGGLARRLLSETAAEDLHGFGAWDDGALVGAILFSRMRYAQDARDAFVLGPVAVAPERQGQGIGQALIRHGLDALRARGVDVALTYGDPAYYGRFGFTAITTEVAAAPFRLTFPDGWQGQSLDGAGLRPLGGAVTCVDAFDDPAFW